MPVTLGFQDVTFKSELTSLQRYLAALFTTADLRTDFREGAFLARPYMLINLVTATVPPHSRWVVFPESSYVINYYATDDDDSLDAMEKFGRLGFNNRVPVYDYDTNPAAPVLLPYFLRLRGVNVDRVPDLEDDRLWSVNLTMTVEGKRSPDAYTGDIFTLIQLHTG